LGIGIFLGKREEIGVKDMKSRILIHLAGKFLRAIFSRSIFVYFLIFIFVGGLIDYKSIFFSSKLKVLNRLRPSSLQGFVKFSKNPQKTNDENFEKFRFYYENVYALMPDRADALGVLGYCSYYLNREEAAIKAYRKAVEMNPHFFWFYYNLGVIHFRKESHQEAIELLSKALLLKPEHAFRFIFLSQRIYLPILLTQDKFKVEEIMKAQLKQGYHDSYMMLILSFYELKDYAKMAQAAIRAIDFKIGDDDGSFFYYAAIAFYELKQFDKATYFLKKCLQKNPQYADAYHYLGLSSDALGFREIATKLLKQAELLKNLKKAYFFNPENIHLQAY